ncbi:MFS transporter [Sphingomonas sp. PP-CE-3A-406]|uniref:MFS transporter n=1 Tax=Sphingomonas sp. PP-CE-3A-406 TaxID=2135659 RepID=UPI000EF85D44|nr:MFS transporter [Sphingomonas sp. PP-CE-3A-406]RMB55643.1 MFS transporter [Sphingomonas sp. PP-CE-3A-406]
MGIVAFRTGWGWLLLVALTISTIGDEISLITLMFRTAGDRTAFAVPMLLVAQLLPGLLVTPYIGRLVDAHDAGKLLAGAALADAVVLSWMAYHPDPVSTMVGAGVLSILFAVGGTATFALIPVLATGLGMTLARANAVLEFVRSAGMLAGPVVGGALVAWGGAGNALLIDAASFALLALVVLGSGLRRPVEVDVDADADGRARTLFAEYLPVLRDRRIVIMIGALALGVFASAIADVAFVFLVTVSLAAGAMAFGLLTACWAGGMMAGAAAAGVWPMLRPAPLAYASAIVMGAMMLAIGVVGGIAGMTMTSGLVVVGIAFVIGGAANSVHNVAVRTMLQREAPAGAHGKVAAIYSAATSSAGILGYMAGGMFMPTGAIDAYLLGGALGVVAGGLGWLLFTASRPKDA